MIYNSITIIIMISCLHTTISTDVDLTGDSYLGSICLNTTKKFTDNYAQALTYALDAVCGNAPKSGGFFQTTQAEEPNSDHRVFALGLCRWDITPADCAKCLNSAAIKVANIDCLNKTGAVTWRDHCLLKYSEVDFLGTVDVDNRFRNRTSGSVWVDMEIYKSVGNIFKEVIRAAAADEVGRRRFAYAKANGTRVVLYAMAQCTRDVSASDCRECLENAYGGYLLSAFDKYLEAENGARSFSGSCTLRYESYPFSLLKA